MRTVAAVLILSFCGVAELGVPPLLPVREDPRVVRPLAQMGIA